MRLRYAGVEIDAQDHHELILTGMQSVRGDLRTTRTDRLGRDGQHAGPDFVTKRVWELDIATHVSNLDEAIALSAAMESAWTDPEMRASSELVPLDYRHEPGEPWYRVYGKPGAFIPVDVGVLTVQGRGSIQASFDQLDPLFYSGEESTTRVNAVAGMAGSGVRAPVRAPVRTTQGTEEPRAGSIVNAGDRPAPVRVRIQGPCTNPRVWAAGFEAGYRGTLAYDQTVTIDGRSMTVILRGGGRSPRHVPGRVTRRTRLSDLTVPAGPSTLWFEADDPTATSYADIYWRDAYTSMQ